MIRAASFLLALASGCTPSSDARTTAPAETSHFVLPSASATAESLPAVSVVPIGSRPPSGIAASVAPPEGTPAQATDDTQQFLGRLRASLRRCYSAALGRTPDLAVTPRYTIDVAADGSVTKVDVTGSDRAPELAACLQKAIQSHTFPPSLSGRTIAMPTAESSP